MTALLLTLLKLSLAPAIFLGLVAVGQMIALFLWDRMVSRELRRAERVIDLRPGALDHGLPAPAPLAESAPATDSPNVTDLAAWRTRRGMSNHIDHQTR